MAEWTCAACGTHNEPSAQTCMVCDGFERADPSCPMPSTSRAAAPAETVSIPPPRPAPPARTPSYTRTTRSPIAPPPPPPASRPSRPPPWPDTAKTVTAPAALVRSSGRILVGVMLAVVLAGGGAYLITDRLAGGSDSGSSGSGSAGGGATTASATTATADNTTTAPEPRPATAPTTSAAATRVGLVTVSRPSALAERVAAMFDTYFSGINNHAPGQALAVFDPSGRLDPTDADQADRFAHDVSTTHDDEIVLGRVADNGDSVSATVHFRSHQQAGYGPASNPSQTCNRWSVAYTLSDNGGELRILRGTGKPSGC